MSRQTQVSDVKRWSLATGGLLGDTGAIVATCDTAGVRGETPCGDAIDVIRSAGFLLSDWGGVLMKARYWLVGALVLLGSAVTAAPALASHSWNGYHWARTQNPFTLKLGKNLSGAWPSVLSTTSSDWSKSTVLDTTIVSGGARPKSCRPTSGRDEICNASYGNTGWLGVAQIWITGGKHITQGTVKLNDYYFAQPQYNTTPWRNLVS